MPAMSDSIRILVAEDDPKIRNILKIGLQNEGYEIIEAADGNETIKAARTQSPALIILDIMMPRSSGYEVARILKFDRNYRDIPIIMLTALGNQENKDMGRQCGADVYLTKPFTFREIVPIVQSLLKKQKPETGGATDGGR